MKTKLIILLSIFYCTSLSFNLLNAQTCFLNGMDFNTQSQVDSFAINNPDCIKIHGDVVIGSNSSLPSDITNLNGLSSIQVIGGRLMIADAESLPNLDGLESLDSIGTGTYGGDLIIGSIGQGDVIMMNDILSNIEGLGGLTYVEGDLEIMCNPLLENLDGLENLTSIGDDLIIMAGGTRGSGSCTSILDNIEGLSSLTSINGYIKIFGLDSLTSLQGLQNVDPEGIEEIQIGGNLNLSYCEVTSICSYLLNGGEGIYINSMGCNSEEEVLLACASVDVSEINSKKPISIYPNPNTGHVNINLGSLSNVMLKVHNVNGQLIYSKENINTPLFQFELDAAPGVYILELSAEGERQYIKMIRE